MGVPENIDALLVKYDITQDHLAKIAGVTPGAVTGWRNGSIPRDEAVSNMCSYFNLEKDDILSDRYGLAAKEHGTVSRNLPKGAIVPPAARKATAPLLGRVHAGDAQEPDILDDEVSLPYEVWERHPRGYFLQVEGDCMDKVYPEGCYIYVDPDTEPQDGSIAAVMIDGVDTVMRRLRRGANALMLSPESFNAEHEDIILNAGNERVVELVGTVVWFQASKEME